MKRLNFLIMLIAFFVAHSFAQQPVLKFNKNGKFKVIQITDTHYIWGNPNSEVATALLKEVIDAEKPDLLVFTGDMVWKNEGTTRQALNELFAPVIEKQVPWAYVFGNHDDETDMKRIDIMNYVMTKPYCLAVHGNKGISGVGNYALEVKKANSDTVASVLYCMDSHAYTPIKKIGGYAWFKPDQIDWYSKESAAYTKANDNKPLPSLAFFHIPLMEYAEMTAKQDSLLVGTKRERECNGKLNSGMFAAMRTNGDIMGTFVGHDHDNDYIGVWYDIALAYGRYSGGKTVYNNLGNNGCRVIELTEGERIFSTYIYLLGGEKINHFTYPIPKPEPEKE